MSDNYVSNLSQVNIALDLAQVKALSAVGIFIEGEAVTRSPVVSGNLKGSWTHKVNSQDKSVSIGSPTDYAIFVEKGTRFQKAQNVLTGAAESKVAHIQRLVEESMKID